MKISFFSELMVVAILSFVVLFIKQGEYFTGFLGLVLATVYLMYAETKQS